MTLQPEPFGDMIPFRISELNQIKINISVGSPPQMVEVVADTGSDFTWVQTEHNSPGQKSLVFHPNKSTSWSKDNGSTAISYLDSRNCSVQNGHDIISIGNTNVRLRLGVGSGNGCEDFNIGILGLSKGSEFLNALAETV